MRCRCTDPLCGPCSVPFAVCKVIGHQPDNLATLIASRAGPPWSCAKHDVMRRQGRLQPALLHLRPTVRSQNEATSCQKRVLAGTRTSDGERLRAHVAQSEIIDLTRLGGAAAAPAVRTVAAVAAVSQDAGDCRVAGRILGALVSDVGTQRFRGTAQPIPGALRVVNIIGSKADVIASIREALKIAPKYSSDTRAARRRCNREAGLRACGSRASEEVLGSSNPYFGVKSKELKNAAQRFESLPDGKALELVKREFYKFIGKGRVYTGASFACGELTYKQGCDELMECARSVGLTVPVVLASPW